MSAADMLRVRMGFFGTVGGGPPLILDVVDDLRSTGVVVVDLDGVDAGVSDLVTSAFLEGDVDDTVDFDSVDSLDSLGVDFGEELGVEGVIKGDSDFLVLVAMRSSLFVFTSFANRGTD